MEKSDRLRLTAGIVLTLAALVTAAVTGCTPDSASKVTSPTRFAARGAALRALTAEQRHRLQAAKARTRWVGDAHHAGMQVVIKAIADHRKQKRPLPRKGTPEYCAIMERTGDAALAVLDASRGVKRGRSDRLARIRRDPELLFCAKGLSVFGPVGAPPFEPPPVSQAEDAEVTGAYELYLDPMYAAVEGSDGTVAGVLSGVDAVLAQAVSAAIPEGDLLALASFAGLIGSSSAEWNAYDWGGGSSSCVESDGCYLMSVFPIPPTDNVRKVLGADALGCLSSVRGWKALRLLLGAPAWGALGGECGVRAAIASGVALYLL